MKQIDGIDFRGRPASKEAIVNASWLWMADLPDELLEPVFRHYLARLEQILESGGAEDPGGLPGGMPPEGKTKGTEAPSLGSIPEQKPKRRRRS